MACAAGDNGAMDTAGWLQIAQSFGLPVGILAVVLFALWRVLIWAGANVVAPLVAKHLAFLDRILAAQDAQTDALAKITGALSKVNDRLDRLPPPPGGHP